MTPEQLKTVEEAIQILRKGYNLLEYVEIADQIMQVIEAFHGTKWQDDPRYCWGEPEHTEMIDERVTALAKMIADHNEWSTT